MKFRLAPGLALTVACCLALTACSSIRCRRSGAFYKKPKPVPEAVNELNLVNADGSPANFPQYWKRNTLVIDLSRRAAAGRRLSRRAFPEETTWPVRVGGPGASGQRRADRNPGRGAQRPAGEHRRHGAHRPRVRAQRLHAEDRGYLHFLGADAGIRGRRRAGVGSRARVRVTDGSAEARAPKRRAGQRQRHHRRQPRLSLRRRPAPDVHVQGSWNGVQLPRPD